MDWFHKNRFKLIIVLTLVCLATLGFVRTGAKYPIGHAGAIRVAKDGFFKSIFAEASATIYFLPNRGNPGAIKVWQSPFDGPLTVIQARDTNVLLMLYDNDMDLRLYRIDVSHPFTPTPPGPLDRILFTCSWHIEEARTTDWEDLLGYLRSVPRSEFFRHTVSPSLRLCGSPDDILQRLSHQNIK